MQFTHPLIADSVIINIPIIENQEPLVDVRQLGGLQIGPSPEIDDNPDYTFMRKSVYDRLLDAQALLPDGIEFCLYEGYRSLELQKILFEERYRRVKVQYPAYSHEELFLETTRLVSPIKHLDGRMNIPPHATGGAIDVYLVDSDGNALDMGMHPKDWMGDITGILSLTQSSVISAQAQAHRHMMSDALQRVGFANYPNEYWHWSYGDCYWAYMMQRTHAIYGMA
jgi:zinc D-Ala-D-Ala dipeptidase